MGLTAGFLSRIDNDGPIALVIGNGIHRYDAADTGTDWNAMIQRMAARHGLASADHAARFALTELYDLIDLKLPPDATPQTLQREFCASMAGWSPAPHHHRITAWAAAHNAPILTTNFDTILSDAAGARLRTMFEPRGGLKRPTDYYPWEKYFAHARMANPCDRFGIWHINGFITHIRSIRLGLVHYMDAVARAQSWLRGRNGLFGKGDVAHWRGRHSWLHIVFTMPLLIFGLQLGTQEVFLRWLLIERARYFRRFPDRRKPAWYVHPASEASPDDRAKYFFLESIGITTIATDDYDAIYGEAAWRI
ncbi:hypothetical protein [Sphingomonas crocodyli]|uniref:SIR2-like domain-containing protein n=1 Tax=Sphingomonas crocodyli TaxID=1979270 RepID=A0A437M6S9_9SPHN|nr:hypothetical protein [Sphingomonas crocodyli]RVT93382.1 hypothetical protein EOD43_05755 [Sphingomonas crocodyli]